MLRATDAYDVSSYTDERLFGLSSKSCHQSYVIDEINLSHVSGLRVTKRASKAVEPKAHGIGAGYKLLKPVHEAITIVGTDGPDGDRATIPHFLHYLVFVWFQIQPVSRQRGRPGECRLGNGRL